MWSAAALLPLFSVTSANPNLATLNKEKINFRLSPCKAPRTSPSQTKATANRNFDGLSFVSDL